MHITEQEAAFAEREGYELTLKEGAHIDSLTKANRTVWVILLDRYNFGWQTADLIDGYYCNHRKYKVLINALNRPLT